MPRVEYKPHLYMNKGFWLCDGPSVRSVSTTMARAWKMYLVFNARWGMLWIDD